MVEELDRRVKALGRSEPVPKLTERAMRRLEEAAAKEAAIAEQEREATAIAALDVQVDGFWGVWVASGVRGPEAVVQPLFLPAHASR